MDHKWTLAACSLICLSAKGFADEQIAASMQNAGQEIQLKPLIHQHRVFDGLEMQNDNHVWVQAELLVWQAFMENENNVSQVLKAEPNVVTDPPKYNIFNNKNLEFDWDPGVRLGIGYKMPYNQFDTALVFTYMQGHGETDSNGNTNFDVPIDISSTTVIQQLTPNNYATKVDTSWHSNLYIGDLELGRHCFATNWLDLRPFIGLRGIYFHQKLKQTSANANNGSMPPFNFF